MQHQEREKRREEDEKEKERGVWLFKSSCQRDELNNLLKNKIINKINNK